MFVIALLSCALGAVACAVSGFLGFIGGIALAGQSDEGEGETPKAGPGVVRYQSMGDPSSK